MKTYFGYIRVSTPKQGRGVSLDEQRAAIIAFAERRGLQIVEWYVETETAAKQGRAEYTKMFRALESGKADGVIIHKIDRGARNMKDWANLGELIDRGLDVQFAHEGLDLRSRGGRLAADIQAVVAADYIRNLRDEVLKGFYGRLKQGVYPLPAPVGYLDRGAGIPKAVDPVMGPLVKHAFERYASGNVSLRTLWMEMRERGLKTRSGYPMSRNGIADMLHSPFYIGLIHIKRRGETFQGQHEPLISKQLFERVQAALNGKSTPKAKRHDFLYRGLVRHAGCSRHLTGEKVKGRFVYYRCHGPSCKAVIVAETELHKLVAHKIDGVACKPEEMRDFRDIVEDERIRRAQDAARDEQSLKIRIQGCDDRLARLTDAYLDARLSKDAFEARNAGLLAEKRGLQDELVSLHGEAIWYKQCREFELKNPKLLGYEGLTGDEKRDLLREICSNFSLEGKKAAITLHSPYNEIENIPTVCLGGPCRDDVRTRAEWLLEIIKSVPTPANENDVVASTRKSLKS